MAVNSDKPTKWKGDIAQSVDFYNKWFMKFAPRAYRDTRVETTRQVEAALKLTENLTKINPRVLRANPQVLPILRMSTAPPIARDRLIGLADVSPNLVKTMELKSRVPPRMSTALVDAELYKIGDIVRRLADYDVFPWLEGKGSPTKAEIYRAATIVADRLCGAIADPIIRNAQERRQLQAIKTWLERRGYKHQKLGENVKFYEMKPGSFSFRMNIPVHTDGGRRTVNIPVDTAIMPKDSSTGDMPFMVEAKSAGDFTNTNKRRKEEAQKISQLRNTYGEEVRFVLFLCGYFDSGYLGYEAAEGIDWVWEHRIDDFTEFGI